MPILYLVLLIAGVILAAGLTVCVAVFAGASGGGAFSGVWAVPLLLLLALGVYLLRRRSG